MPNSLTTEVGLKVGPVILERLVKHYFDRVRKSSNEDDDRLKEDDVLYDQAFTIVKSFLSAATFHTVEELQGFSNTRTPSPPWVHVVRTRVPMSCCEEAAPYLIKAMGGEDVAKRLVGGVKWWQVRGINGVDAQWITAKKDWQEAKKKHKAREQKTKETPGASIDSEKKDSNEHEGVYSKDMDAMRCILYLHGGGYYFGSVDQERYSIQRHARKINGRVFAINYRLAPQYPFPCGLQDAVAAYLFLIRPPAGSDHVAVNPAHILIAGDSAGGGLSLALLQVIRDSGLPLPAGAFLISPWCDLTHSFPSVHSNTDNDIVPESGLSFHKPSILWPPPPPEVSNRVHASLRFRIRQAFKMDDTRLNTQETTIVPEKELHESPSTDHDPTTPVPALASFNPEKVTMKTENGETVEITEQLHFYAQNSLLAHPLVSSANSYLGGLPPLLIIAGDKEVLRDEIIYTAHKAAYPERYPVTERARQLYPCLEGIEFRYKPTSVHLQVYDGTPHILPVLFSFTTPAKFCFRAIASFCKLVTEMTPIPENLAREAQSTTDLPRAPIARRQSLFAGFKSAPPRVERSSSLLSTSKRNSISISTAPKITGPEAFTASPMSMTPATSASSAENGTGSPADLKPSLRRSLSARLSRVGSQLRAMPSPTSSTFNLLPPTIEQNCALPESPRPMSPAEEKEKEEKGKVVSKQTSDEPIQEATPVNQHKDNLKEKIKEKLASHSDHQDSVTSSDVGGPRFHGSDSPAPPEESAQRMAGEISVYADIKDRSTWECRMIRERVSTAGVVRALEPEGELSAFQVPPEKMLHFSDLTLKRYLRDRAIFEKKFAHTMKTIEKHRRKNLDKAKVDTIKRLSILKQTLTRDKNGSGTFESVEGLPVKGVDVASGSKDGNGSGDNGGTPAESSGSGESSSGSGSSWFSNGHKHKGKAIDNGKKSEIRQKSFLFSRLGMGLGS